MLADWNVLSEDVQLFVSREALCRAREIVASQVETLAQEIEAGTLSDRGGPDALRLLVALVGVAGQGGAMLAGAAAIGHA